MSVFLFLQSGERPSKIFLINCLSAIQQPLLRHSVAAAYVKNLGDLINKHLHILVEKEVDAILRKCGLSEKMSLFRSALSSSHNGTPTATPLADTVEMSPTVLAECLKAFFGLILGSDSSLPEFEQMQVPKLRSDTSMGVARSLADAYEVIYTVILDPKNGYADPRSLARHPPDQIRTILGI